MVFTYQVIVDMPGGGMNGFTVSITAEDSTHALAEAYDTGLALARDKWPRGLSVSVIECVRIEE